MQCCRALQFGMLLGILALINGCDSNTSPPAAGSSVSPSNSGKPTGDVAQPAAASPSTSTSKPLRIAVIPKGTTHEFWKSVHAGAESAAKEMGQVEVLWKGPLLEDDRDGQINVVQDFVTQRVDGIVLAPLDSQALVNAVKDAKSAGIPTVMFGAGESDISISRANGADERVPEHCLSDATSILACAIVRHLLDRNTK